MPPFKELIYIVIFCGIYSFKNVREGILFINGAKGEAKMKNIPRKRNIIISRSPTQPQMI